MPRTAAAAVTVLCLAVAGPSAATEEGPWWENEPLRIIQTNLRQIDADRDPAVIVQQVKDLGANTILFSCGGIRAFYQTDREYHKKAIALKGDFAVEARRIAREQGRRFIGRLDLSKAHAGFREGNPDWFQRGADGVSHEYNGLHVACPNGTYYRDYSHEIIREVLERIEPDALFFNMFGFTRHDYSGAEIALCHCPGCQTRYQELNGEPLPKDMGPDHRDYGRYQDFQRESIRTLVDELKGLIHRQSGGKTAFFTYVDTADVRRMEANSGLSRRPRTNFFSAAQQVGRFKTMYPDKPVGCTAVNFLDMPYRYSSEPAGLTGMRLVQALANLVNLTSNASGRMADTEEIADVAVRVTRDAGSELPESRRLVSGGTAAAEDGVYTIPWLGLFETIAIPLQQVRAAAYAGGPPAHAVRVCRTGKPRQVRRRCDGPPGEARVGRRRPTACRERRAAGRCRVGLYCFSKWTSLRNESALSDAPPTSAPSTSGSAIRPFTLSGFTLPP